MSGDPILILQMRRMGDLILTFPLMLDLLKKYPGHPLLVAAEPQFFKHLLPFSPPCQYVTPQALPKLSEGKYKAIINLSSQREAALCAARAEAEFKLGPLATPDATRIAGFWQLYRASLTANNRHNLFHWADLYRLDLGFPLLRFQKERQGKAAKDRLALFVGASEPSKRPDAAFWISLVRRLKAGGKTPILLGGPAEKTLGAEIALKTQAPNFCGLTDLPRLGALLSAAELVITPDTGPMHLANWLGAPVLNLSLGNVSPHETGPHGTGQWIAQASMSCSGCWKCWRGRQYCRNVFTPQAIANAALAIVDGAKPPAASGLKFSASGRDSHGLYELLPIAPDSSASTLLSGFWKKTFLCLANSAPLSESQPKNASLVEKYPALVENMTRHLEKMLATLRVCQKKDTWLPEDYWREHPWHSRLFAGFTQMFLQNEDFSSKAWQKAIRNVAMAKAALEKS